MQKMSFLTGLATGVVASIVAVIAVPSLTTSKQRKQDTRTRVVQLPAERARPPWHTAPEREPAADSAAAIKKLKDAEEMMAEARALEERVLGARRRSNETAAIATLRNIASAQAQFQSTARADENNNGVGEFSCFSELSGRSPVREGRILNPPVLSTAFRKVEDGRVHRSGYYYRIFLPRADGYGLAESSPDGGYRRGEVNPELSETTWCCYAWPVERSVTGDRAFFINQAGDILATDGPYSGDNGPAGGAAFHGTAITGETTWKRVG